MKLREKDNKTWLSATGDDTFFIINNKRFGVHTHFLTMWLSVDDGENDKSSDDRKIIYFICSFH